MQNRNVKRIYPSGYCKGVVLALQKVKKAISDYPDKQIYILGMIVHNRFIVQALNNYHVISLDDPSKSKEELLDQIQEGVIIFTAHGSSDVLKEKARGKGLIVIDATCPDVEKNSNLIKEHLKNGYTVLYIGKRNHPEAEAVLSIDKDIILLSNIQDIDKLNISNDKIFLTNQTTMSILDIQSMIEMIQNKYPQTEVSMDICNATYSRQKAIMDNNNCQCMVIVGDPVSNNTTQLARIATSSGIKNVIKVEDSSQLSQYHFEDFETIYVTAGASTPAYLINQVINYLKTLDPQYLTTDIDKIL